MKQLICDSKTKICSDCDRLIMLGDIYWVVDKGMDFSAPINYTEMDHLCNGCFSKACRAHKPKDNKPIMPEDMFPDYKSSDNELFFEG